MLHSTLQQIISAIEITSAGQIIVNEQPQMADYLFISPSENKNTQIKKLLSDIIYQKFYCQHSENEAIILSEKAFIQSLKKSNLSKNKLIDGFKVLYADTDGSIIVEKKQLRKRVPSGMYLRKQNGSAIDLGEVVKVYTHCSFLASKNAFYHVFGETPDMGFPEAMVRFYFHLKPTGSPVLIQKLGQVFNTHKIFFQFKCLKILPIILVPMQACYICISLTGNNFILHSLRFLKK